MIKVTSGSRSYLNKIAQGNFFDDIRDVDWGDDEESPSPWDDYLVDEIEEEPPQETEMDTEPVPGDDLPPPHPEPVEDQVTPAEMLPDGEQLDYGDEYMSVEELLSDAMGDPPHLIKFDYTTRHGRFTPDRIVEPHRIYSAYTTGNDILLTFDRTVGDIRGFIIGNIKPFGVLYENTFSRRPEIMRERPAPIRPKLVSKGK